MASKSILVAGVAVIDFVFHMKSFPDRPEKYRADDATIVGGGNAANASVAIARLGGHPHLAARLSNDQIADMIIADLTKNRVDCSLIKRFDGHRSSFSSIYLDGTGERQIMNYRDHTLSMDAAWLVQDLASSYDAALADTRWPDGALAAMQWAAANGKPGIIDAEAPVHEALPALQAASHVAFSAQGARDLTKEEDIHKAAQAADLLLPGMVIITDGENGAVSVEDGNSVHHPAFPIETVDTLGAGDVWHGALALMLASGASLNDAITYASAAAAIKCSRQGGRDGAPSDAEVKAFLDARS